MAQQTFSGVPSDVAAGDVIRAADADLVREFILFMLEDGTESTTGSDSPLWLDLTSDQAKFADGSAATPGLTPQGDGDTGLFVVSSDALGISAGGAQRMRVTTDGVAFEGQAFGDDTADASAPAFTFQSDGDTGMYRISANIMGLAAGGTEAARVTSDARFRVTTDGLETSPALQFGSGSDGIYHDTVSSVLWTVVNGSERLAIGTGSLRPGTDNSLTLGSGSLRWSDVYAASGTVNSSDAEVKDEVADDDLGIEFLKSLQPRRYRFAGGSRPHYGFVAQEVKQVMDEGGFDFAGYVDPSVGGDGGPLGLRYAEFIGPLVSAVQELDSRVDQLERARGR